MPYSLQPDLFASDKLTEASGPLVPDDYLNKVRLAWKPLVPTAVFATYWYFAAVRQKLFYCRVLNQSPPWTSDPILRNYRFTNAYRASDRVSQYLIRNILYSEAAESKQNAQETLFRLLLFKLFNRIETWQLLERSLGSITWKEYSFDRYDAVLTAALERGDQIFSAAYIMPSGQTSYGGNRKHRNCLQLLENIISEGTEKILRCRGLKEVFLLLRSYPMLGDFLAFQFTIDINYSQLIDFSEDTFVVAGPGARDGIEKCFSNAYVLKPEQIIQLMHERQTEEFARLNLKFQSLWGRSLQPIDCQNLFCEVSKYARVAHPTIQGISGRTRIKQGFRPGSVQEIPLPYYPPDWGLNQKIVRSLEKYNVKHS